MPDLDRIRRALDEEQDEARVQRMWRNIEGRRNPLVLPRPRAALFAIPVFAVAAAAAIFFFVWQGDARGPLALENGGTMPTVLATPDTTVREVLSDGSALTLEPEARVELLENSATKMGFALRRGRARFDIVPGGPRTWRVECGDVTVEVVGTIFTVEREGDHVSVVVERGAVLVRGDRVPDRVQRLHAGDAIEVRPPTAAAPSAPDASVIQPAPVEEVVVVPAPAPEPRRPSWRESAAQGDYDAAFDTLGEAGVRQATQRAASVDDLMTLADVARLSGHPRDAVAPLARVVDENGSDRRAALAAYTLGTLYLDSIREPARAAGYFDRALSLGVPRALREPALAHRAVAYGRSGSAELGAAIDAYVAEFPEGSYRTTLERLRGGR